MYRESIHRSRISIELIIPTTSVGATPFTAALAPNPAYETTTLTVTLQNPSDLTVSITDVGGRRFRSQIVEGQAGENRVPIAVGGLPNGLYFVQVVDERGSAAVLKMAVGQ